MVYGKISSLNLSDTTVYRTLKRHGLNSLPQGTLVRKVQIKHYNKQVPGHHIQMDVKFLKFNGNGVSDILYSIFFISDTI